MVGDSKDFNAAARPAGRVLDVLLAIVHPAVLYTELHDHFQDNEGVFYCLDSEPAVKLPEYKVLYTALVQGAIVSEFRKDMVLQNQHIGCKS